MLLFGCEVWWFFLVLFGWWIFFGKGQNFLIWMRFPKREKKIWNILTEAFLRKSSICLFFVKKNRLKKIPKQQPEPLERQRWAGTFLWVVSLARISIPAASRAFSDVKIIWNWWCVNTKGSSVTVHMGKPEGRVLRGCELFMTWYLLIASLAELWVCSRAWLVV